MIDVTSYETTNGLWREARLERMLAAMRSFLAHASDEPLNLNEFLISVHDHKGSVEAIWKDAESKARFSRLLDIAWTFQNEPGEYNTHSIAEERVG